MFENKYPLFNSGRILKIEMLEDLRNFPRDFINIRLKEYSDGIISGCEIDVEDDFLIIKSGIIKHKNTFYTLNENIKVKYESNNKTTLLKIKFLESLEKEDFIKNSTEIYLDDDLEIKENEIELCRFKLRTGAKLRINHIDFNDLTTEYDTVNTINCKFSTYNGTSLSPNVLKVFGSELLKCNVNDPWDIAFGMNCIQSKEPIEKEIIINYLVYKLNVSIKDYSNEEIYFYLLDVLKAAKNGSYGKTHEGRRTYKKILVD